MLSPANTKKMSAPSSSAKNIFQLASLKLTTQSQICRKRPASPVGKSVKKAVAVKRKIVDCFPKRDFSTQTDEERDDIALITGDEPPPSYWKELAQKRQKMIEELVEKNEELQDKVEILENENNVLESMLDDARKLAEYVSTMPDDPDESGIERDHEDDGNSGR